MEYTVLLRRGVDGGWRASAEGLPGCTVRARSREAALDEIRTAINLYVQGLLEESIDEPGEVEGEPLESVTVSV